MKKSNNLLYLALLVVSLTAFGFSFCFSSTEREFTLLSSVGCSGIVSVLVAWLLERSNDRIQGIKNTECLTKNTASQKTLKNTSVPNVAHCKTERSWSNVQHW
mgnify:CR=1 FL=1